ncbi:MAG: flagellar M-ring protein FliF [Ruminococcaceae bacterium]|nr:flagellar M-ring protein FliF [Oscillospiraceae bacterium]
MKDQLMKAWGSLKAFWNKLTPKVKKISLISAGLVFAAAIAVTALLHSVGDKYQLLYPENLSGTETSQVYAALQDMNANPQINAQGQIMVPKEQWGELIVALSGKGYPKSAPVYDIFLDNTGFTKTDFEKRQILQFQLQNRIQDTLVQIDGVKSATVTITMPENTEYVVWDKSKEEGSASVMITMESGYELSPEMVSAIRNHVAASVSSLMKPENVKVIDAATGVEMTPENEKTGTNGVDFERLEFEKQMQKDIEDNVKRLLAPIYGADGVTAVAKVKLDYDKMLTEQKELVPQDDGNGVKTHLDENYSLNGNVPAAGIVGEENNTDTPEYLNQTGDQENQATDYSRSVDWETSYIKTQIEKGQAILKEASVAVVVKDSQFDQERHDNLVDLISKSVAIDPDSISVKNLDFTGVDAEPASTEPEKLSTPVLIAIAGAAASLLILIIVLIVVAMRRRAKKALEQEEQESDNKIRNLEEEIEQHKKQLLENAQVNSKENAITNEIRTFANENPEITASLIRSMLKEDE